jgi:hypothetical protein
MALDEVHCRLCGTAAPLKSSHIIPAFVARWLKETSATGFLRTFHHPNRRSQDFKKIKLLCEVCEQRFSRAEDKFARLVFLPFHEGRSRFPYEDWLLHFAVSLAWRCSVTSSQSELERYPQHIDAVEAARRAFADYLLERTDRITPYRVNIFFTPLGVTSDTALPDGLSWYLLRAPDGTPVYSGTRTAIYVKLPGMFFWTSITPPDPGGWRGTKINRHGSLRSSNQVLGEPAAGQFLMSRVQTVFKRARELSPKQQERIDAAILGDPQRLLSSKTLEALLDDERIRAEDLRKRR